MKSTIVKFAVTAAMAAGMMFGQTPAGAARPRAGEAGRPMARRNLQMRLLRQLNLTDAQRQQAKSVFQEARQSAQPLAKQLKTNRQALTAAVKANDSAQIRSLAAQQGSLQGQVLGIRREALAKVYAMLTPEQKAKADELRQKARERKLG